MSKIESILLKNGYKKVFGEGYSSVKKNSIYSLYLKGEKEVYVGLNEKGYPPSLINPRPLITKKNNNLILSYEMRDSEVIDWIQKSTDEEIINFLENK
jgi:hypothetical protein